MEENASGTVGYAGLSAEMLISRAKALFAQAQPPVPERFSAFLPLFPAELVQNMDYLGIRHGAHVAPNGFSIDPTEYHAKLYARMPELYAGDNALRNFTYEGRYLGESVFTVDEAWAEAFPQYRPFLGERLSIRLIGGSGQAVAVPESVYPRGGGVLDAAEEALGIAERGTDYAHYVQERVAEGETYDAEAFAADYLTAEGLSPVRFTQNDLARVLQDLAVVKSLQGDESGAHSFTEYARLAERVGQYVPMRYACDHFTVQTPEKRTVRLAQLCFADNDFISDLWMPYVELSAFADRRTLSLDARRVCAVYQIAPRYDPETGGGLCPDTVRVATVHDTGMTLMTARARNNPAYGDGLNAEGAPATLVFVPDSREMIRQRRVSLERCAFALENRAVAPEEYRKMQRMAVLQEQKGRLIDALHRRETALRQLDPSAPIYEKARTLLNARVDKVAVAVARESAALGETPASGYDEDIAYLRRMERDREGLIRPAEEPFTRDGEREQSIEGGYAMRGRLLKKMYAETALPEEPVQPVTEGADDSEDGEAEHLPAMRYEAIEGAREAAEPPAEGGESANAEDMGENRVSADLNGTDGDAESTDGIEARDGEVATDNNEATDGDETTDSDEATNKETETDEIPGSENIDSSEATNNKEPVDDDGITVTDGTANDSGEATGSEVSAESDEAAEPACDVNRLETKGEEATAEPAPQTPAVSLKELARRTGGREQPEEKPGLTMAQLLLKMHEE